MTSKVEAPPLAYFCGSNHRQRHSVRPGPTVTVTKAKHELVVKERKTEGHRGQRYVGPGDSQEWIFSENSRAQRIPWWSSPWDLTFRSGCYQGFNPWLGTEVPHAWRPKTQNIKQEQYGSQFNEWVSAQLCPTLYNPMDWSPPSFPAHRILQVRILELVVISYYKGISPTQESNPHLLYLLHWQMDFLPLKLFKWSWSKKYKSYKNETAEPTKDQHIQGSSCWAPVQTDLKT